MADLASMFAIATNEGGSREYICDYAYFDAESWHITNLPTKWDPLLNNQAGSDWHVLIKKVDLYKVKIDIGLNKHWPAGVQAGVLSGPQSDSSRFRWRWGWRHAQMVFCAGVGDTRSYDGAAATQTHQTPHGGAYGPQGVYGRGIQIVIDQWSCLHATRHFEPNQHLYHPQLEQQQVPVPQHFWDPGEEGALQKEFDGEGTGVESGFNQGTSSILRTGVPRIFVGTHSCVDSFLAVLHRTPRAITPDWGCWKLKVNTFP